MKMPLCVAMLSGFKVARGKRDRGAAEEIHFINARSVHVILVGQNTIQENFSCSEKWYTRFFVQVNFKAFRF